MKKLFLILSLATSVNANAQISGAMCGTWEAVMTGQTLGFREAGLPIGIAEESFNGENDARTRVFLKRIVRLIYADPVKGKNYLMSGGFLQDCIKTHRGF